MQNYALYLDARIRSYRDLKHDPIRVQTDANRDHRTENEIEASRGTNTRKANGPQRSKTIIGRKLRSMTVEKGLLRETKAVQKTIDTLLECRVSCVSFMQPAGRADGSSSSIRTILRMS